MEIIIAVQEIWLEFFCGEGRNFLTTWSMLGLYRVSPHEVVNVKALLREGGLMRWSVSGLYLGRVFPCEVVNVSAGSLLMRWSMSRLLTYGGGEGKVVNVSGSAGGGESLTS